MTPGEILAFGLTRDQFKALMKECMKEVLAESQPQQPNGNKKEFLNVAELSELTGMGKQSIYNGTANGTIPFIKRHGKLLFDRAEILTWLKGAHHPAKNK